MIFTINFLTFAVPKKKKKQKSKTKNNKKFILSKNKFFIIF